MAHEPPIGSLDTLLAATTRAHGYPALAAAVASGAGVLAAGASGVRKTGDPQSVTIEDRFHLGSIAKPMAATVLATLVEEGRLGWETTPRGVFPEFAADVHPALHDVRLEQLLAHRAGIAPFTDDAELAPPPPFTGSPRDRRLAFAAWLLGHAPSTTPGTEVRYSNAGYAIVAAMAERVADRPWEALVRERLFAPLGLVGAGFGWPAAQNAEQPWGHRKTGPTLTPHPPDDAYQLAPLWTPAGDVHATMPDLAKFGRMHLRGLAGEETPIRAETVRRLHAPLGTVEGGDGVALGWGITETGHQHAGSAGTFFALLVVRPEHDRVYAFATNAAASDSMDANEDDARLAKGLLTTLIARFEGSQR